MGVPGGEIWGPSIALAYRKTTGERAGHTGQERPRTVAKTENTGKADSGDTERREVTESQRKLLNIGRGRCKDGLKEERTHRMRVFLCGDVTLSICHVPSRHLAPAFF